MRTPIRSAALLLALTAPAAAQQPAPAPGPAPASAPATAPAAAPAAPAPAPADLTESTDSLSELAAALREGSESLTADQAAAMAVLAASGVVGLIAAMMLPRPSHPRRTRTP